MPSRRVHRADADVIVQCAARGDETITVRKLERWRQAKCLPARQATHPAGIRGTATVSPEGYVEQVLAISALLRSGLALRYVPLALFADGFQIEVEALRSACLDLSRKLRQWFLELAGDHADPLDQADAIARGMTTKLGGSLLAPMANRARKATVAGSGGRREANNVLASALSAAFTGLFAGQEPSIEGTGELLDLAGLLDSQDLPTSARHLADTSLDSLERAVLNADEAEWISARSMVQAIYRYVRRRVTVEELLLAPGERLSGLILDLPEDAFSRGCLIPQQLVIGDDEREFARRRAEAVDVVATTLEEELAGMPADTAEGVEQRRARAGQVFAALASAQPETVRLAFDVEAS